MRFLTASALVISLAVPSIAAAQKESETIDRSFTIGQTGRLKLNNFSGEVRITGTSGTTVEVHAVRRATRERLENIKLDMTQNGSSLTIEANRRASGWRDENNNVVETDFDIKVPSGISLDIDVFSSKVDVRGVTGEIEVNTFSGNIEVDATDAAQMPELTAETFSGDIETRVSAAAAAKVRFNSFSGSVRSDLPISGLNGSRRGRSDVSGEIGGGAGPTLRFKTFSGDLRISR